MDENTMYLAAAIRASIQCAAGAKDSIAPTMAKKDGEAMDFKKAFKTACENLQKAVKEMKEDEIRKR